MTAPTLFDWQSVNLGPDFKVPPMADGFVRDSDPETSREAAQGDRSTLELDVLSAVRAAGWVGASLDDVHAALGGRVRHGSVSRRLTSLERAGLVEVIGKRKAASGRAQQVYRATAPMASEMGE